MRTASVQRPNRLDCYSECGADVAVAALAGDVEVLVDDAAATTTSSRHPDGPERVGYAVGADQPLRPVRLQGFWNTLEDFLYEQQWSDFQRDSYDHWDRDAWRDCKRKNLVHIKFNNRRASAGTWHGQNDGRVVSRKKGRLTSQHPRRSGRLNFTRSWLLAGVLGVNAVSAHCQLYIHDAVPSRWQLSGVGNDTNDPPAVTPDVSESFSQAARTSTNYANRLFKPTFRQKHTSSATQLSEFCSFSSQRGHHLIAIKIQCSSAVSLWASSQ